MKARRRTVKLETGDVRQLRIFCGKRGLRLAIYDEDTAVPVIQAKLSEDESHALRKALGEEK